MWKFHKMKKYITRDDSFKLHRKSLIEHSKSTSFIVFLCGPSIKDDQNIRENPAAKLRKKIKDCLEYNNFEVVLGEDDGLEDARLDIGLDAQSNELQYISKYCNAVVVVTCD